MFKFKLINFGKSFVSSKSTHAKNHNRTNLPKLVPLLSKWIMPNLSVETPAQKMLDQRERKSICKHNIVFKKIPNHRYKSDDIEILDNAC